MDINFKRGALYLGWESPKGYALRYWLFSFSWYYLVKQIRFLGLTMTLSRMPIPPRGMDTRLIARDLVRKSRDI